MPSSSITTKFSTRLKKVINLAWQSAKSLHHKVVDTDHLLLALSSHKGSVAAQILKNNKVHVESLREQTINNHPLRKSGEALAPLYTGNAKRVLIRATWIAEQNHHHFVGTEHLLAALLTQRKNFATQSLRNLKIDLAKLKEQLNVVLRGTSHFPELTTGLQLDLAPTLKPKKSTPLLDNFGIDLNKRARRPEADPLIGREEETARLIDILERRGKNNALLLGEPGVGKTALVEGLAREINLGNVTLGLRDRRIVQLDIATLVAGTAYRGDYEERLRNLLREVQKAGNVILFIDEIHTIVGSGNLAGSLDTANILKMALAGGQIRVIGATTPREYKSQIEKDSALARRFQAVRVREVSAKQTEKIIAGLLPLYEKFHQVKLERAAIKNVVIWSQRYIPERFLPDKAIDVIDEALARKKVLLAKTMGRTKEQTLREQYGALRASTERLIIKEQYREALQKRAHLSKLGLKLKHRPEVKKTKALVASKDLAQVIARISGIPAEQITNSDTAALVNLAGTLKKRVVGQPAAVRVVSDTLLRARAGLQDPERPLGTFLFMGPSGVGKTELARALAEQVFMSKKALIKLDMSEFSEKFNVSRMIGSPPGYVGFGEGGRLTEAVRRNPYSVILFDEIEKAHPDVANILLQIFEDGQLTDASGHTVSFKNCICILTSNLGNRYAGQGEIIGFGQDQRATSALDSSATKPSTSPAAKTLRSKTKTSPRPLKTRQEIKKMLGQHFKPELLGRLDKVVVFRPLNDTDLKKIFELEIKKLKKRAAKPLPAMSLSPHVFEAALKMRDPDSGARFIRNFIQEHIEPALAYYLINHAVTPRISIDWDRHREGALVKESRA